MAHRIVEFLHSIPAPFALAAVFLLSALETAIFLGVILPGELAVIIGGALASRGRVPLVGVLAAGILGPIVGDSIGYFVGRRYGRRFFRGRRREKWSKARLWLRRRGASAVLAGRFMPYVRSIIPAAAGVARVPFRRFFPWCVAAGISWGGASALLGYFVGKNLEKLESFVSRFNLVILTAVILGVGLYVLRRRLRRRRGRRARRTSARRSAA
ncbi:MAG TPA: DedA family protein [Thermoanaerobaculia bacterium]|nr:DedA family protein [Thermoanaerobaculia bacterium]